MYSIVFVLFFEFFDIFFNASPLYVHRGFAKRLRDITFFFFFFIYFAVSFSYV
jgi:hypothetical protein